ncbi:hypothetical protein F5882DRAFT_368496 [Hyaloscypha sp. PMI_1271]|nr:hypothetical protein F5882DRAFT_368496 [Hyaloscypha sp. PMI_1271]
MVKDVGGRIDTIEVSSLKPADTPVSSSTGYELICSYNWANHKAPTTYVPGGAAVWKDMSLPISVPKDSGMHFIDQNASRIPTYPFEVVFQAIEVMRPSLRFDTVDVLINRNSMRKLLDFCHGRNQDSFRINLHIVRNTLIIERCEKNAKEMIRGSGGSGYGHNFERTFTQLPSGLEDSSSHHRVLRYSLGDLSCAIRFEVDACYKLPEETKSPEKEEISEAPRDETTSLVDSFDSLQIRAPTLNSNVSPHISVCVVPRGIITAQSSTAEIKTRTKSSSLSKILPQLWFGRTPYLITGHHTNGTFDSVNISHVRDQFEDWERKEANQNALRKLASLLSQLREAVKRAKEKACIGIYERGVKPVALHVFVSKQGRKPLPEHVVMKYWAGPAIPNV